MVRMLSMPDFDDLCVLNLVHVEHNIIVLVRSQKPPIRSW